MNEKRAAQLKEYLSEKIDEPNRFTITEGPEKEKAHYHERPKFLIRFEATSDSLTRDENMVSRKQTVDRFWTMICSITNQGAKNNFSGAPET